MPAWSETAVFRQLFARNFRCRNRAFLDRPDRFAGFAVERVGKRLLGDLDDDRHGLAVLLTSISTGAVGVSKFQMS